MERLVQYLDDLEDFIFGVALVMERLRRAAFTVAALILALLLQTFGVLLALMSPPLALALASLLCVGMIYAGVTTGFSRRVSHA